MVTPVNSVNQSPFADAIDGPTYLTPDAMMTFCSARLRGLDDQMQTAFLKQRLANDVSKDLSDLQTKLNTLLGSASSLQVSGKATEDSTIKAMARALLDTAHTVPDPAVAKALTDRARALVNVTGDSPNADFKESEAVILPAKTYEASALKGMTSDAVAEIQKDVNSGSELSMINLQSLMSQRQSAVQLVTNMVQALGDQMNKITSNIGH